MVRAIELVKSGEANVVVSCGNTGALMACGTLRLRTMEGVARPALAAVVPREGGHFVLIDAGANPEPKPEHLVHNAILGSHYCRVMLGIPSPRVGLMSIGTEDGKGNSLITETNDLLKRIDGIIKYSGPIEGFQVFTEHVDVVVCDGFVGNVLLKFYETVAPTIIRMVVKASGADPEAILRALPQLDADSAGGAPLLGVRGVSIISHGKSNAKAIKNAIGVALRTVESRMTEHAARRLSET